VAFLNGRDIEPVGRDRVNKIDRWCVGHSGELLGAPVKRAIQNVNFSVLLGDTRVEPEERVEREQLFIETNLRVRRSHWFCR